MMYEPKQMRTLCRNLLTEYEDLLKMLIADIETKIKDDTSISDDVVAEGMKSIRQKSQLEGMRMLLASINKHAKQG